MTQQAPRRRALLGAAAAGAAALLLLAACATGSTAGGGAAVSGGAGHPGPAAPGTTGPGVSATGAPATTVSRTFVPFTRSGAPAAGVAARRSGSCFTASITVRSPLAYRCFAGNAILDPCFARTAAATTLDCYADPWSRAVELRVTAALPTSAPLDITRPWALELADGRRCVVVTGTAPSVQGVVLGYRCGDGAAGLAGTSGSVLTAVQRSATGAVARVAVSTVWRG